MGESEGDFKKNLTVFYQISLKTGLISQILHVYTVYGMYEQI